MNIQTSGSVSINTSLISDQRNYDNYTDSIFIKKNTEFYNRQIITNDPYPMPQMFKNSQSEQFLPKIFKGTSTQRNNMNNEYFSKGMKQFKTQFQQKPIQKETNKKIKEIDEIRQHLREERVRLVNTQGNQQSERKPNRFETLSSSKSTRNLDSISMRNKAGIQSASSLVRSTANSFFSQGGITKMMVNLEELIQQEERVDSIYNSLNNKIANFPELCISWWNVTEKVIINEYHQLFKDDRFKQLAYHSQVLEIVCISLVELLSNDIIQNQLLHRNISKCLLHIHQNLLIVLELVYQRLPKEKSTINIWGQTVNDILDNKKSKIGCDKIDNMDQMRTNNLIIQGLIVKIMGYKQKAYANTLSSFINGGTQRIITVRKMLLQIVDVNCRKATSYGLRKEEIFEHEESEQAIDAMDEHTKITEIPKPQFNQNQLKEDSRPEIKPANALTPPPSFFTHVFEDADEAYAPYLPKLPKHMKSVYTLFLDLDETLIHFFDCESEEDGYFLERPGCREFLREMGKYYELVIFTAAMQDYADWIIDQIDPEGNIKHRLYRQHATSQGALYCKDLDNTGRKLQKSILVDNVAQNFLKQPENGIFIKSWFSNEDDQELYELIPLLRTLVEKRVKDVRVALRSFRDQMLRMIVEGVEKPHQRLNNQ